MRATAKRVGTARLDSQTALCHFAIENIDGKVEDVEARGDSNCLVVPISSQQAWSKPDERGVCEVFELGEDGATPAFVARPADREDTMPGEDATARSHALD